MAVFTFAAPAIATTKARMHHAVTSPIAAQSVAIWPNFERKSFRSCKMRTSTGNAVMLMEMPITSANGVKEAPDGA